MLNVRIIIIIVVVVEAAAAVITGAVVVVVVKLSTRTYQPFYDQWNRCFCDFPFHSSRLTRQPSRQKAKIEWHRVATFFSLHRTTHQQLAVGSSSEQTNVVPVTVPCRAVPMTKHLPAFNTPRDVSEMKKQRRECSAIAMNAQHSASNKVLEIDVKCSSSRLDNHLFFPCAIRCFIHKSNIYECAACDFMSCTSINS